MTKIHFAVGCAQLGMTYGIANTAGQPEPHEAQALLKRALEQDCRLDTAPAYGDSEVIIGECIRDSGRNPFIATKVSHLEDPQQDIVSHIQQSVEHSLQTLNVTSLGCLFLHSYQDYVRNPKSVTKVFGELHAQGHIRSRGVSVYTPEEAQLVIDAACWDVVQIPFNILDARWLPLLAQLKNQPNKIQIWVRSVYLQGLCLKPVSELPEKIRQLPDVERVFPTLTSLRRSLDRSSLEDLCINYVRGFPELDTLIIGCESLEQLESNLQLLKFAPLNQDEIKVCQNTLSGLDESILDPRKWS